MKHEEIMMYLKIKTLLNFLEPVPFVCLPYLSLLIFCGRHQSLSVSNNLSASVNVSFNQPLAVHMILRESDPWILDILSQPQPFSGSEEARVFLQSYIWDGCSLCR